MTWVAWRQFRSSAYVAVAGLAVVAAFLAITTHASTVVDGKYLGISHDHLLKFLSTALVGLPALIGAFWGGPLIAREYEAGTHRLAWTQSVSRTRWLGFKLAVVALAAALACGGLSLMLGSWSSAAVNSDRFSPAMFAERGIVPVGYAVYAVALGVLAGALIRRTVPAMATTLGLFLGTRIAVQFLLRPHLVAAHHLVQALKGGLGISQSSGGLSLIPPGVSIPGAWVYSTKLADSAGQAPTSAFIRSACGSALPPAAPRPAGGGHALARVTRGGFQHCIDQVTAKFHVAVAYHPSSQYWPLQWAETATFLALAGLLVAVTFWWVKRRLA